MIARADRDRRQARRRSLDRKLGLQPAERLADGLRRMTLGQLDLLLELSAEAQPGAGDERAVHEMRKALKRTRALLSLLSRELGETTFAREDEALRQVAARLSATRDAEVMLATLDGLIARHPKQLRHNRGVAKLRSCLAVEHARLARRTLADPGERARTVDEL